MEKVRKGVALGSASIFAAAVAVPAWAADLMGQPTPQGIDLQPAATQIKADAIFFHNAILMPIITLICLLVLGLLIWIMIRYNRKSNPTPARFSHNTVIEVIWTVLPVLILMFISIFSFRLLYAYHDMPKPDLTVKVTGNQWYWSYEYPDANGLAFDSHMLPEAEAKAKGVPYRLAADNPLVVPVGKVVRVLVTGADVIHAFAMPAFGSKIDAIPGRVNETWFKADKTGVFYGQCSELCGPDHAFMPIQINVMDQAGYDAWLASKAPAPPPAPAPAAVPAAAETATAAPATAAVPAGAAPAGPTEGAAPAAAPPT